MTHPHVLNARKKTWKQKKEAGQVDGWDGDQNRRKTADREACSTHGSDAGLEALRAHAWDLKLSGGKRLFSGSHLKLDNQEQDVRAHVGLKMRGVSGM